MYEKLTDILCKDLLINEILFSLEIEDRALFE